MGLKLSIRFLFFNNASVLSTVKTIAYNNFFDLSVVLTRKTSHDPRMICLQNEIWVWSIDSLNLKEYK